MTAEGHGGGDALSAPTSETRRQRPGGPPAPAPYFSTAFAIVCSCMLDVPS